MTDATDQTLAPVITVDGPSGVGKGTVCQWLAARLGWHLLDSGALYRLTALAAPAADAFRWASDPTTRVNTRKTHDLPSKSTRDASFSSKL